MTNKITLSRELAELCYRSLNGGDNQLTGMEHGRAFRELRAALAEPVPPAGGEPEVVAYLTNGGTNAMTARNKRVAAWNAGRPLILLEDHRAHVTRLQEEVAEEKKWRESAEGGWREANKVIAMQRERLDALQSELTKARELLHRAHAADTAGRHELPYNVSKLMDDIEAFLQAEEFNQSAPADKGQPVAWQFYQDGKWWNGDDRIKDHRINTVAAGYKVRDVYAEQPAPVAVVMPERANAISGSHDYQSGYNTCIEDVARLNGVKP